jgi:hypothetical protein
VPGRVNIQFMVKLYGDQSAPITPESAAIASFGRLIGPYTISSAPGSVLNRPQMEGEDAVAEIG